MKRKEFELSRSKKVLLAKKRKGEKEVIWRIENKEQLEYLKRFFAVEPWLFEIRTRKFFNIRAITSNLLKDVHYANKKGKKTIVRKLKKSDFVNLDNYGVKYRTIKYRIILN